MSAKVEIRTDDNHVEPICKYLMHMDYTNLIFMGLPGLVISFPMFHIQAQYVLGILEGRIRLPSPQQMREDYENEKKSLINQGIPVIGYKLQSLLNNNKVIAFSRENMIST